MKPKRLSEVRALVEEPEFQQWWAELVSARAGTAAAQGSYDELLAQTTLMEFRAELTQKNAIDTLYQAGECEDSAAGMLFEATELENRSFRVIAEFEEQRFKVSDLWYKLGASEKALEEAREAQTKHPGKKSENELKNTERSQRTAQADYERETARKNRLWEEVERIWAKSAEVSLLVAEQRGRGRKVRKEAEGLFALAEERKQKSKQLRAEAEKAAAAVTGAQARNKELLDQARERFGCAAGSDFLYFRQKDNQKLAFCIPLVEDHDSYNVEVKPLSIYSVERQRGVSFLEPARADSPSTEEGDRRFEEYFLTGRKGEVRSAGA
ncbi:MAG: hypothetical protein ACYC8T_29505 [Myxococcaceae bacterium]